jgi:hypothetical protein
MSDSEKRDLVDRLRDPIISEAFEKGQIIAFALAERIARERQDAADEIQALRLSAAPQPPSPLVDETLEAAAKKVESYKMASADATATVNTVNRIYDELAAAIRALKPAPAVSGEWMKECEILVSALAHIRDARGKYGATGFPVDFNSSDPYQWAADYADAAITAHAKAARYFSPEVGRG